MRRTFVVLVLGVIIITITLLFLGSVKEAHPYDPFDGKYTFCWKCVDGKSEFQQFESPGCPVGWSDSPVKCYWHYNTCWRCNFDGTTESKQYYRMDDECPPAHPIGPQDYSPVCGEEPGVCTPPTPELFGIFIPYEMCECRGYMDTSIIKVKVREHFNYWIDNPYQTGHVCRHMCMEIEEYLEVDLGIDCLWGRGEKYWSDGTRTTHVWLYILTRDVNNPSINVFYGFDSVPLAWKTFTESCMGDENQQCGYTLIEVNHGNYIYGKRVLKDMEAFIWRVPNSGEFNFISTSCPTCLTYPYQYGEDSPMNDVVLPLNPLQMFFQWIFGVL